MFDPVVLFQLGPLTVTAYGVCLAVAIAVSLLALRPRAKRMGMPEGTVLPNLDGADAAPAQAPAGQWQVTIG